METKPKYNKLSVAVFAISCAFTAILFWFPSIGEPIADLLSAVSTRLAKAGLFSYQTSDTVVQLSVPTILIILAITGWIRASRRGERGAELAFVTILMEALKFYYVAFFIWFASGLGI